MSELASEFGDADRPPRMRRLATPPTGGRMRDRSERGGRMTASLFDLTGKLAVVTGARRGIGLAIAEALAAAGADIVAVSAHQEPSGSAVEARVTALGRTCTALTADFADRAAVLDLAGALAGLDRPIDILVNNAGTIAALLPPLTRTPTGITSSPWI